MQTFPVEELIGKTVGSSRPVRLLGHGKLSVVYEAQQPEQNRSVMLTLFLIPTTLTQEASERFLQRFREEAISLSQLDHPAILPIYDFGEYRGHPYLVTPFVSKVPLARHIKQRGHFSPQEALGLLQQIASCLDYAHSQNVIHGTLSSNNILVDDDLQVQVAGFGFMRMLEARNILPPMQPYAYLLSVSNTFLGSPEYMAPEYVQGQPADGLVDIYALGVVLYELLSGTCPFEGKNPYEVAIQHVERRVPSLHEQFAFVPAALDVVIDQALERNPAQRFQTARALANALERVLRILDVSSLSSAPKSPSSLLSGQRGGQDPMLTMPPTVNWLDEELIRAKGLLPAASTGTGLLSTASVTPTNLTPDFYQDVTTQIPGQPVVDGQDGAVDPFAWWSAASQPGNEAGRLVNEGTSVSRTVPLRSRSGSGKRGQTVSREGRRRTVTVLAVGGVVALTGLGFGGVSLAHLLQKKSLPAGNAQARIATTPTQGGVPTAAPTHGTTPTPTHGATATPTHAPTATPNPAAAPTTAPKATPTAGQQPPTPTTVPTAPPPPTPTPAPAHTGTVIGSTNQGNNSSVDFQNPADGQSSMLIHSNGNFAAFEKACTHEGAATYYDTGAQVIRCTRHSSGTFDPGSGSPKSGPPPRPLPQVQIRVNGDGTITTG
jgi:serine/threonine-protein kinase